MASNRGKIYLQGYTTVRELEVRPYKRYVITIGIIVDKTVQRNYTLIILKRTMFDTSTVLIKFLFVDRFNLNSPKEQFKDVV